MKIAIIGSGYGGAVAAHKLTAAGMAVDLIEMGADWESMPKKNGLRFTKMTQPNERSMWFKNKTQMPFGKIFNLPLIDKTISQAAGVLDVVNLGFMNIYVGRGVGGGSLVNGGMAVVPSRSFFEKVLPSIDAEEMYSTYFPQALRELGVAEPPQDLLGNSKYYQFARIAAADARKVGYKVALVPNVYDWNYMREESMGNVPASALDGQVIFGNDYGKKSLPHTLLKTAFQTGLVNLRSLTEVTKLAYQKNGQTVLTLKTIDFRGAVLKEEDVIYDSVIVAAGSVGTAKILLKTQAEGNISLSSSDLGKYWGPNGNIMAARKINKPTGTYQSGIPAMGVTNWDDSEQSVFAELAPLPAGIELQTNLYLAITNNPNYGQYQWDPKNNKLTLDWTQKHAEPSVRAAKLFLEKINKNNPGSSFRTDMFNDSKELSDYFTYHPLGGAVQGKVTDENGELVGAPGVFVMDGSLIPAKIGVNPFVTITALTMRNMDKLISAGRFTKDGK